MSHPQCGLILLDYDSDPHMPEGLKCNSPEEFMAMLVKAVPEFDGVGYSAISSSSNGIYDQETKKAFKGGGGMHIYIAVENAYLDALKEIIKVRLWNEGFGYISLARNGALLERTITDLAVFSPER